MTLDKEKISRFVGFGMHGGRPVSLFLLLLVFVVGASGCAFTEGKPMAEASVSVTAGFKSAEDRLTSPASAKVKTAHGFLVEFTSPIELTADSVSLVLADDSEGGEGETKGFDPAHPPAGVELCHNGHCHMKDGKVKTYAEVKAEMGLSSGGASVYRMMGDHTYSVTVPSPVSDKQVLGSSYQSFTCEPLPKGTMKTGNACDLPKEKISLIKLHISKIKFNSRVTDSYATSRLSSSSVTFNVDQSFKDGVDVTLPIEGDVLHMKDGVYQINLVASVTPSIFDSLEASDFASNNLMVKDLSGDGIKLSLK